MMYKGSRSSTCDVYMDILSIKAGVNKITKDIWEPPGSFLDLI